MVGGGFLGLNRVVDGKDGAPLGGLGEVFECFGVGLGWGGASAL